jgi:hypothetical protein
LLLPFGYGTYAAVNIHVQVSVQVIAGMTQVIACVTNKMNGFVSLRMNLGVGCNFRFNC